jgi:hypothetical protein
LYAGLENVLAIFPIKKLAVEGKTQHLLYIRNKDFFIRNNQFPNLFDN